MKVRVDDDRCGGHGVCCVLCPEVFQMTDDGYSVAYAPDVPARHDEAVKKAAVQCPTKAISIE